MYNEKYNERVETNKTVKVLNILSLGLVKNAGRYYLTKWTKRQMKLADYFFARSPKFKKIFTSVNRKKGKIDNLIYRLF